MVVLSLISRTNESVHIEQKRGSAQDRNRGHGALLGKGEGENHKTQIKHWTDVLANFWDS